MAGGEIRRGRDRSGRRVPVRPTPIRTPPAKKKIGENRRPRRQIGTASSSTKSMVLPRTSVDVSKQADAESQNPASPSETSFLSHDARPRSGLLSANQRREGETKDARGRGSGRRKRVPAKPTGPARNSCPSGPSSSSAPRRPGCCPPPTSVRDLDRSSKPADEIAEKRESPKERPAANIRLAAMPEVKQPSATSKVNGRKSSKTGYRPAARRHQEREVRRWRRHRWNTYEVQKQKEKRQNDRAGSKRRSRKRQPNAPARGVVGANECPEMNEWEHGPHVFSRRPIRNHSNYRRRQQRSGPTVNTAAPRKDNVVLQLPCTVREFSEAAGVPKFRSC